MPSTGYVTAIVLVEMTYMLGRASTICVSTSRHKLTYLAGTQPDLSGRQSPLVAKPTNSTSNGVDSQLQSVRVDISEEEKKKDERDNCNGQGQTTKAAEAQDNKAAWQMEEGEEMEEERRNAEMECRDECWQGMYGWLEDSWEETASQIEPLEEDLATTTARLNELAGMLIEAEAGLETAKEKEQEYYRNKQEKREEKKKKLAGIPIEVEAGLLTAMKNAEDNRQKKQERKKEKYKYWSKEEVGEERLRLDVYQKDRSVAWYSQLMAKHTLRSNVLKAQITTLEATMVELRGLSALAGDGEAEGKPIWCLIGEGRPSEHEEKQQGEERCSDL
ncbi:hypothetical protein TI39_contig350g00020 [Zymoseptoria brevis]|uniref:Uncharacterized protein n=1 Tax=Zymoseptoria brevis TaxID=1047168 RepID=A0A0F4GRG4_9PEZI|nr:hypothetical protein TI39_contig350g00020 [Zymoseptoria brevis]